MTISSSYLTTFLPRDAMRTHGLCCRPVSVRPSVCLSRWCMVSRQLKMSNFSVR